MPSGFSALGGADRIGGIDDDEVDRARRGILHPLDAVAEEQRGARILVAGAQFREVLLRQAGDALIYLHLHRALDLRMLEHLGERAAVPAADHHHRLRIGVRVQRRVAHHLVVEEVVAGGDHGAAVNGHEIAEGLGLPDLDLLVGRLLLVQLARLERKAGAGGIYRFGEPRLIERHV
jgi:hypothetical protein